MAEWLMKFQETQQLLDVAHHCSVLVFPLQKLLCFYEIKLLFTYLLKPVREFDLEADLVRVPHRWYLSGQSFITRLKLD